MPRVARKKFEIKVRPHLTFEEQVQNAFCNMHKGIEKGCVIGSGINLDENSSNFLKVTTFHDFSTDIESGLSLAAIPVADIIRRLAQGWNVDVDEVLAEIKVWLDSMSEEAK